MRFRSIIRYTSIDRLSISTNDLSIVAYDYVVDLLRHLAIRRIPHINPYSVPAVRRIGPTNAGTFLGGRSSTPV